MSAYHLKAPAAELDYAIDWAAHYLEPGETIAADLGWTIFPLDADPDGLRLVSASATTTETVATLAGGRLGATYRAASRIRTSADRIDERAIVLRIAAR